MEDSQSAKDDSDLSRSKQKKTVKKTKKAMEAERER